MCIIVDANALSALVDNNNADMKPVRNQLTKSGGIACAHTEKFNNELTAVTKAKEYFAQLKRNGKLKVFPKKDVQEAENSLPEIKSGDPHIIALAQVAKVTVLVSGDKKLHEDFTNPQLVTGGKIYQNANHQHLLRDLVYCQVA